MATVATSVLPWMAAKAAMEVLIQTTALVEKEATEATPVTPIWKKIQEGAEATAVMAATYTSM